MAIPSVLTSAWVWLAFAFVLASVCLCVWALMCSAGQQSREEEAAEEARFLAWRRQKEQKALVKLRAEFNARRQQARGHSVYPSVSPSASTSPNTRERS